MKTLNISFEDKEFEELLKIKKDKTWRQFMLDLIKENEAIKNGLDYIQNNTHKKEE